MTRNLLRPILIAFLLLAGSLMVGYSLAGAVNTPPEAPVGVEEPAAAAKAPTPVLPAPAADEVPATPAAPVVTPEPAKVQSPAAARLIGMLIDILSVVLLILVPYFVHRGLAYFEKKTGLELSPYMKDKLDALLDKGLAYAEEQSHKVLKANEVALTMSDKLEFGASYVLDLADATDAKSWTTEKVKKMLEARLNETRGSDVKEPGGADVTTADHETVSA